MPVPVRGRVVEPSCAEALLGGAASNPGRTTPSALAGGGTASETGFTKAAVALFTPSSESLADVQGDGLPLTSSSGAATRSSISFAMTVLFRAAEEHPAARMDAGL